MERNPGPMSEVLVNNFGKSNYAQPCSTDIAVESHVFTNSSSSWCGLSYHNILDYSTVNTVRSTDLSMSDWFGEGRELRLSSTPSPIQAYITNERRPNLHTRSRNAGNLINICCESYAKDDDTNINTKSDLYAVTETWLKAHDDTIRAQLCPIGYKLSDKSREGYRGGGIPLFYKDSFTVNMVNCRRVESFKYLETVVSLSSSSNFRIIIVYRPP